MAPKVSIIIPTYNRPFWLEKALESCVKQDYPNLEIIVVDDGSENSDAEAVAALYSKIKYVWHENRGLGYSRNEGISISTGEYIQFLDDDDWLCSNAISRKVHIYYSLNAKTIVYSDLFLTDVNGKVLGQYYHYMKRPLPSGNLFPLLIKNNFIPVHAILWSRDILEGVGGFPERSGAEDWECLVRASFNADFISLDEALGYYRLHTSNMSFNQQNQLSGDTEVQELIVNSRQFADLDLPIKVDCLANYALRQWLYGTSEKALDYYQLANSLSKGHWKVTLLRVLFSLGRNVSRRIYQVYWKTKQLLLPHSASNYFLSRL